MIYQVIVRKMMNYQNVTLFLLLTLLSFMPSTYADGAPNTPLKATFTIVNRSGGDMYFDVNSDEAHPSVECGHWEGQDKFPIANGKKGTLTLVADDPNCLLGLTELTIMKSKPSALVTPFHSILLDYGKQGITVSSTDFGFGLQNTTLNNEMWDWQTNKNFTITTEDISKKFLARSHSTATITIQNRSSYPINVFAESPENNDGNAGMVEHVANKTVISKNQSATLKVHTSENGSAYATLYLANYVLKSNEATIYSALQVPVDVGPDYGTPVNEAFAVDTAYVSDETRRILGTFDNTVWDGKKDKKFTLTIRDMK